MLLFLPLNKVLEISANLLSRLVLDSGHLSGGLEGSVSWGSIGPGGLCQAGRVHATGQVHLRVKHICGFHRVHGESVCVRVYERGGRMGIAWCRLG